MKASYRVVAYRYGTQIFNHKHTSLIAAAVEWGEWNSKDCAVFFLRKTKSGLCRWWWNTNTKRAWISLR